MSITNIQEDAYEQVFDITDTHAQEVDLQNMMDMAEQSELDDVNKLI